jgi:asparagine N-glycosylation enzyme membrane subunit Stt3
MSLIPEQYRVLVLLVIGVSCPLLTLAWTVWRHWRGQGRVSRVYVIVIVGYYALIGLAFLVPYLLYWDSPTEAVALLACLGLSAPLEAFLRFTAAHVRQRGLGGKSKRATTENKEATIH